MSKPYTIYPFKHRSSTIDEVREHLQKEGAVCVWGGCTPALLKIKGKADTDEHGECYQGYLGENFNSLSISNLRPATQEEVEILGDRDFLSISVSDLNVRHYLKKPKKPTILMKLQK